MRKIVIWGASGHAFVVYNILKNEKDSEIFGFIDDTLDKKDKLTFCELPVFGSKDGLSNLLKEGVGYIIIAIGNCSARHELSRFAMDLGFRMITAIHPTAIVDESVIIGPGSMVIAGAILNPGVTIGSNVIINTGSKIDHGCNIGDSSHICPGVNLAGNVIVGSKTWIGIGSTVIENKNIGSNSVIGAGSVVVTDIPDNVLAYGVPAKIIKHL